MKKLPKYGGIKQMAAWVIKQVICRLEIAAKSSQLKPA